MFSTELWAAILGAVLGTLGTGVVSFLLQKQAFEDQKADRQSQERSRDQVLGHALFFKLMKIHSQCGGVVASVKLARSRQAGSPGSGLGSTMLPLANPPPAIHFEAAEMALLLRLKRDVIFNNLMNLEAGYNSLVPAVQSFPTVRQRASDAFTFEDFDPSSGASNVTFPTDGKVRILIHEADQLAEQIASISLSLFEEADVLLSVALASLNQKLDLGLTITNEVGKTRDQ